MLLPEIITAFEKMCKTPIKSIDDILLFETFMNKTDFCFFIVRQIQVEMRTNIFSFV